MLFGTYRYSFYTFSKWLWMLELILTCSVVTFLSIRAYIAKRHESGPILLGVGSLVLAGLLEITNLSHFRLVEDIQMFDYPFLFFMLCMPYALAKRYVRLQSRIKLLSGNILTAQEGERKRLARELHDGLGQGLLAVKLNLQRINQRHKSDLTEGVIREVSSSIKELQDISRGLRPAFLDDIGLEAAIRDYCNSLSEKTDMTFEVRGSITSRPAPEIEENLFRIFQESTSNAIKHSKGNRVIISLKSTPKMISMEVRDNGIGLDSFEDRSGTNGLGLSTMEERATLMGGDLNVKREKDGGTLIIVEVPLK
jgi:signal transduction histidine kinase